MNIIIYVQKYQRKHISILLSLPAESPKQCMIVLAVAGQFVLITNLVVFRLFHPLLFFVIGKRFVRLADDLRKITKGCIWISFFIGRPSRNRKQKVCRHVSFRCIWIFLSPLPTSIIINWYIVLHFFIVTLLVFQCFILPNSSLFVRNSFISFTYDFCLTRTLFIYSPRG